MTKQWPGAGCMAAPQPDRLPVGRDFPWLAPLAGYSDLPFRALCREYGAACCVTEMVSAKGLCYNGGNTWKVLATADVDTPLVVQLFGAEPEFLERAVHILRERGFVWFDLNMGCPVPKVAKQGAGVTMLTDPDNALACARAMIGAADPGHVSFKLRLGVTDKNRNWLGAAPRRRRCRSHHTPSQNGEGGIRRACPLGGTAAREGKPWRARPGFRRSLHRG